MNEIENDQALDKWLSAVLTDEPLADGEEFTATVLHRVNREAGRRRAFLVIGYIAAGIVGLVGAADASAALASITSATLAGTMTLSAVCGVVWIGTAD